MFERQVIAKQGIAGLYSGVQAAFVGSIISSSIYFGTYELGKGVFTSIGNCPKTLVPPLAAAIGNITSSAILVPKEVVKQRMQAGMVGSALEVFLQTIRTEGIGGLYAGYSAALLRNLPSNIISFSTFVSTLIPSFPLVSSVYGDPAKVACSKMEQYQNGPLGVLLGWTLNFAEDSLEKSINSIF